MNSDEAVRESGKTDPLDSANSAENQLNTVDGYRVQFSVQSAQDLPQRQTFFCGRKLEPNAFAHFTHNAVHGRTTVEMRTSSPIWAMDLLDIGIVKENEEGEIHVDIMDKGRMGRPTPIGIVNLSLKSIVKSGPGNHQRQLKIFKYKHQQDKHGVATGEVLVKFRNDPIE